jgi:hypothetical protein
MNPPKGYYRELLKNHFPEIRIAFTHTPIYGCSRVDAENVLKVLDASTDPHAKFYSDGIRGGQLVTIVENGQEYVYKNNGELYFRS